jgi:CHASE2 domain-containing sensor protein
MRSSRRRLRTLLFVAVGLFVTALGLIGYATNALRSLELDTVNARFSIRGHKRPPSDLIVVKVDDATFQDLNLRPPFPRHVHGRALDEIARDKPKVIAYDFQFTESTARREDTALEEAILNAGKRVVLSTTEVNDKGQTNIFGWDGGDPFLREIGARPANGLFPNDPGGVLRRVTYSVDGLKTLAVVSTETATRHRVDPHQFGHDGAWIDYYGPPGTIRSVSFSRVEQGKLPRGFFRNKLVVVGPTAPTFQDLHPTSTSVDDLMSGAEIQASALDTVRRGLPLRSAPGALNLALIVLLGAVAPLSSLRLSPLRALALALALGALFALGVQGRLLRVPDRDARALRRRSARHPLRDRGLRAGAGPRPVLALRAGERGGRRPGAGRRGPAPWRRPARGDRDVHGPPRLHELRGDPASRPRDRGPQRLPE